MLIDVYVCVCTIQEGEKAIMKTAVVDSPDRCTNDDRVKCLMQGKYLYNIMT